MSKLCILGLILTCGGGIVYTVLPVLSIKLISAIVVGIGVLVIKYS